VAPIYNDLIADGLAVCFKVVHQSQGFFYFVPAKYEALRSSGAKAPRKCFERERNY